jgi:amino acid adenylation domain-containing protein
MTTRQPRSNALGYLIAPGVQQAPGMDRAVAAVDPAACEQSIAERFEQQVSTHPTRLAVQTSRHALTYAALNQYANRVARALLHRSETPGERVGLLLGHDAPLIAAILGTLKAGKVYVPLDPSHPLTRSRVVVELAQATTILTDAAHASPAAGLAGEAVPVINVDDLGQSGPDENVDVRVAPDDLAYIVFTSGSTGEPKGVVQTQRNVLHFAFEHAASCRIGPDDRLSLLASVSYAAAGLNLYAALLNGATIYPFSPKERSVADLVAWLEREAITVYHSVPTVFRNFACTLSGTHNLPKLRVICLGGEPALKRDAELFQEHFAATGCVLVNGLASTETMVIRRYFVDAQTAINSPVVPAGYPVDGADVFLVDEDGQRLGPNEVGEIVVRSRYLALGYWRQPALTQRAFSSAGSGDAERLFRTGDLGRLLPDGCLEYLGRKDRQVKVRGHRVEPAEIELALLDLKGVEDAAVVPRPRPGGDSELVAYLVANGRPLPSAAELRRLLSRSLPEPLIPAAFVALDALPRTPNGKIDRAALIEPPATRSTEVAAGYVAPRNPLESRLAELWEAVLGVHPIGLTDDFFELGGHSLLASRLVTEIERVFGKHLAPASLFPDATLAHQARLLSDDQAPADGASISPLVPIRSTGSAPPFFCVHPLGGDVLCFARLAHYLGPDQPFYAFQDRGEPDQALPNQIPAMAARYVNALRSVQPEGPYFVGGFSFGGTVAFEIAQQLLASGQPVALLAILDHAPFTSGYRNVRFEPRVLASLLAQLLIERPRVFLDLDPQQRSRYLRQGVFFYLHKLARGLWSAGRPRRPSPAPAVAPVGLQDEFRQFVAARPDLRRFMEGQFEALAHLAPGEQARLRRVIEAEHHALTTYVPRPYPGRITLFRARAQPLLCSHDPSMGWRELASGGLEVRPVPGPHAYILKEPFVRGLARELAACLASSRARAARG